MSTYRFHTPPSVRSVFEPLPEDDYDFKVAQADEPYPSPAGNTVLPLKLLIAPDNVPVWANPWDGVDKNGKKRYGIAEFLLCVNRAPAEDEEPDWSALVGAKGRCHLKVEVAKVGALAGKEVNKVAWFHVPRQLSKPQAAISVAQQVVKHKLDKQDDEPDDIPF